MADDLTLIDGQWVLTYYSFAVGALTSQGTGSFSVHAELWDGDPCLPGPSVLEGTQADFISVPIDNTPYLLEVEIAHNVHIPIPETAWLALTFSHDAAGWIIARQAETGSTQNLWSEDNIGAPQSGCIEFVFGGTTAPWAGYWATVRGYIEIIPRGACCDRSPGAAGACNDAVPLSQCSDAYDVWTEGMECADVECDEVRGACCELLSGACGDDELQGPCLGPQQEWTEGIACVDADCVGVTGVCCDGGVFGVCYDDRLIAECTCPDCTWFKRAKCEEIECEATAIPIVSEWGVVVLMLLFLIAAKLRFSRVGGVPWSAQESP